MHPRGQGAVDHRHSRQARALYERRAVPPLHPHRLVAAGRHLYISDGYGNSRVHKYSPDGKLRGCRGASPAPIPASSTSPTTSAATRTAGSMSPTAKTTASRCSTATANTRRNGTTCIAPPGLYMESGTKTPRFYVGEIGPDMAVNIDLPNCGPRVSIYTHKGELLARLGHAHAGLDSGQFISPHGHRGRFARRHLCRRGVVHQLGPPRPRQGRAIARPASAACKSWRRWLEKTGFPLS